MGGVSTSCTGVIVSADKLITADCPFDEAESVTVYVDRNEFSEEANLENTFNSIVSKKAIKMSKPRVLKLGKLQMLMMDKAIN